MLRHPPLVAEAPRERPPVAARRDRMEAMQSRVRHRFTAGALALALATLAGCAADDADPLDTGSGARITVGAENSAESRIVAQLYGQALAHHGYAVDYNEGVGDRASFIPALQAGIVDIMPDTSGALLYGADPGAFARSSDAVIDALPKALGELGLTVFDAADADNAEAFVVTDAFSTDYQVTSIGDLSYRESQITIGGPPGFLESRHGQDGLLSAYRLSRYSAKELGADTPTALVSALLTGAVQVAVIPRTTPSIELNSLVVLRDPKSLITAQNIVPVASADADHADVRRVIDEVSALLTTDELRSLNARVLGGEGSSPDRGLLG
jgi:osmoprotectant transport system substrate-binding protein